MQKVNVLGTEYKIHFGSENDYPGLKEMDGYTDSSAKEIIIDDMSKAVGDVYSKKNLAAYQKQVLRHEIIHAFLSESGLDGNGHSAEHWEYNEEMVDWMAIQSPKIFLAFMEAGALE